MNLLDLPVTLWSDSLTGRGEAGYRGRQIAHWVFKKGVNDFKAMKNLPQSVRDISPLDLSLEIPTLLTAETSIDGTRKMALRLHDGPIIESVLIPRKGRMTLCLSTQAGCGIGCRFCRTAAMGLLRNLTAAEMIGQWIQAMRLLSTEDTAGIEGPLIDHIVFMGMGEPLANLEALIPAIRTLTHPDGVGLSPRRITVSTSGLVPKIDLLGEANLGVQLAVSLCAPDDLLRGKIMPVGRIYSISDILDACRRYPLRNRERVTFEYVLLSEINDTPDHAKALGRLLSSFRSKVNLIPFNPFPDSPYSRPPDKAVIEFANILAEFHLTATVRKSKGPDVFAACGQLARDRNDWTHAYQNGETIS